ncbi:2-ketoisovalerate ferredoxin oxidoreductase subunit alpha [Malaciobacter pacificus]|uniref:Pyruvate:ferredoxin oxidoreductase, alpha subunit n=1 Tax=Malaciobacter pacificus TaxID=1080223 RepID=A0A5C2H3N6_9BACT|nr:2-oxoacid:ferredoxin oxidoreductase subunit alpha [Malaciobacter pacificus]QEP33343.1 pyruvate:ferredoxin oxidoreductase, alpha subunit [Malaciobacter pacificus]GGD30659.1 2-ketoisovalerate ferredoxin oxidoreductase subunit alpha [Malaciobacter pacificus]
MNKNVMELREVEVWDGNMANSQALRQADVDVVAAYPITPSTATVENYAMFHANGYIDGEVMMTESEHAAMSACVGAGAAGGRVATATSSQGLALMIEVLYQASGMRIPVVLCLVNRALAAPLNVNGDHSDLYLTRDSGWISLDAFSPQEAYDMTLMAFKISEHPEVRLPVISNQDGFMTSHTAQNVRPLKDEVAAKFVGEYLQVNALLNFDRPVTHGVQTEQDWHFEHKAKQHAALMGSKQVILETFAQFKELTGREYKLVESYGMEDAQIAIVCLGSTYETAIVAIEQLKEEGIKAGVIAPRLFRPFPLEEVAKELQNVKAVACMDRSAPGGTVGTLYNEVSGALINTKARPLISNLIYGLGGRDMTVAGLKEIFRTLNKEAKDGKLSGNIQRFIGVRGPELSFYNVEGK